MSGYQPYPAYKPSGSEWLGDVPKEWDIVALKYVSRIVNGGTPSSGESDFWDGDIIWYTPEDLGKNQKKTIECSRRKLTQDGIENSGANLVPEHSVILSTRAPIGHVAITNVKAATNQGCKSLVAGKLYYSDFLYYCIASSREPLQAAGKGTTFLELSATNLGQHTCPLPEYVEQKSIADFLDRETARIDALAGKKRELIDRLKEKRAALITRTVTRGLPPLEAEKHGLNPNPPLKPSGIDWLGDVPEHWGKKPLKYIASINDETLSETTDPEYEICYVDIGSVSASQGITKTESINFENAPSRARRIVQNGDTIVSTVRTYLRAIAPIENPLENMIVSTGFAVIRPINIDPAYLSYALRETRFVETVVAKSVGVSYPAVNASDVAGISLLVPEKEEQKAIADFLDYETAKIDALIQKVETGLDQLQEYRAALITAAVTGKIDVRKAAGQETGEKAA